MFDGQVTVFSPGGPQFADLYPQDPDEVGYYRLRPPVKPITVGELTSMPKNEADVAAVERS